MYLGLMEGESLHCTVKLQIWDPTLMEYKSASSRFGSLHEYIFIYIAW